MTRTSWLVVLAVAISVAPCAAQKPGWSALPQHLVIGVDSYFDFGPPFSFYQVLTLDAVPEGVRVERAQMSASADICSERADFKLERVLVGQSMTQLLEGRNVCAIPEKELHRKRKDGRGMPVFSGAHLVLEAQCAGQMRLVRTEVLDRDIYDSRTKTPVNTAWAMTVLTTLNESLGGNGADKPMFAIAEPAPGDAADLQDGLTAMIAAGRFDEFFGGGADRPSELLRLSALKPQLPDVTLESAVPLAPVSFAMPVYPAIAKAANVSGKVEISVAVTRDGRAEQVRLISGPKLLDTAAIAAVEGWQFPVSNDGVSERVVLDFERHCAVSKP